MTHLSSAHKHCSIQTYPWHIYHLHTNTALFKHIHDTFIICTQRNSHSHTAHRQIIPHTKTGLTTPRHTVIPHTKTGLKHKDIQSYYTQRQVLLHRNTQRALLPLQWKPFHAVSSEVCCPVSCPCTSVLHSTVPWPHLVSDLSHTYT